MKKNPTNTPKSPGQALVEFALVLPILLLVIYGLLEVGRLLFIYSSVVSAARQAARYGATTGVISSGSHILHYQDCDGMREAAKKMAFINTINDTDIAIDWDSGEGAAPMTQYEPNPPGVFGTNINDYCRPGPPSDTSFEATTGNINRIRVEVRTLYTPIIPILPFDPFEIRSVSARTILVNVPIIITAAPQGWDPYGTSLPTYTRTPSDTPTPSKTPTASQTGTVTNTPTASRTPTNTGTPTKTGTPTNTSTITNTPTNTATPIACDVRHGTFTTSPFSMSIINKAAVAIHISQIQIYWGPIVNPQEAIITLNLGGANIWIGIEPGSPAVMSAFTGDVSIPPGGSKSLTVGFLKNYVVYGTEQIIVSFVENGCPTLDSSNTSQLP